MKRFLFACGTRDTTASFGLLVLRVVIGGMMLYGHGWPKLQNFSKLAESFPTPDFVPLDWMSSTVSLSACIAAELLCAALLVMGLLSRHAAFAIGFTMVVAAFQVGAEAPLFLGPGVAAAKEPALLYLVIMIVLILTGPGRFSLDGVIDKPRKGGLKISL